MYTHVAWLSFSRLIWIMFCELPLIYFHRLPERKLLSGGVNDNCPSFSVDHLCVWYNQPDEMLYCIHYKDVIMSAMASQITSLTIVYSAVYTMHRSTKTSKLRVTGLYAGNSPVTGEFPTHTASNMKNVSIWWRHHEREMSLPYLNLAQLNKKK